MGVKLSGIKITFVDGLPDPIVEFSVSPTPGGLSPSEVFSVARSTLDKLKMVAHEMQQQISARTGV